MDNIDTARNRLFYNILYFPEKKKGQREVKEPQNDR